MGINTQSELPDIPIKKESPSIPTLKLGTLHAARFTDVYGPTAPVAKGRDSHLASDFHENIIGLKGFISNENWDKIINVSGKVSQVTPTFVTAECIMDRESHIIESRVFPKDLFANIPHLRVSDYVVLCIKSKAGSTRIDVHSGVGLVSPTDRKILNSPFEVNDLEDEDLNQQITSPIKL